MKYFYEAVATVIVTVMVILILAWLAKVLNLTSSIGL